MRRPGTAMGDFIRNALAAATIILSLGSGVISLNTAQNKMQNDILVLQNQVSQLAIAFQQFRCSIKQTYDCVTYGK